jgi:hypothetical protein
MAKTFDSNTIEIEKALKQLKCSYDMYETTKKQTERKMKEALTKEGTKKYTPADIKNELELITEAQNDVVTQYLQLGGKEDDIRKKTSKKKVDTSSADNVSKTVYEMMQEMEEDRQAALENAVSATATRLDQSYIPTKGSYNSDATFDVIPLPSKGEAYADKIAKMSVAYLTAYDENMIVSPNLYRDNLILDYILQEKLLSKEIDPMDLLEGDRDAIILFLRASGYGNEYPITATDEATGKEFEAVVDLSKLKYKEFKLKGDSKGWFSFTLPVSGAEVKFRFPTHRDIITLDKLKATEENKIMKETISNYVETLDTFIEADSDVSYDEKVKIRQAIRTIDNWGDKMDEENSSKFNHSLTNRLSLLIMAVDGITDKKYINEFIRRMNVKDSTALRKYMNQNEPGIDYNIEIERPASLGGGSMKTFLQLDQFLFLNIADGVL